MKKIINHPIVDVILTFLISYFLIEKTVYFGDFLTLNIPKLLGLDLVSLMGEDLFYTWYIYIGFIAVWICGLIIFSVFKSYRPILKAFTTKLKGNNIKMTLIGGLSLGFGLNILIALVALATGAIKIHYVGLGIGSFVLLLIAVLVQSGAEELVARAFIYQRLRKNFPKWPMIAVVGNGLFFVMIHLGNPGFTVLSVLTLLSVSVMYSLVVYYFDSLWIPIVAHTTWNFTQSIVLGLPNSGVVFPVSMFELDAGVNNFAFDSVFGIEGSVLAIIINLAVCVGIYCYGRKKGAKETYLWNE